MRYTLTYVITSDRRHYDPSCLFLIDWFVRWCVRLCVSVSRSLVHIRPPCNSRWGGASWIKGVGPGKGKGMRKGGIQVKNVNSERENILTKFLISLLSVPRPGRSVRGVLPPALITVSIRGFAPAGLCPEPCWRQQLLTTIKRYVRIHFTSSP